MNDVAPYNNFRTLQTVKKNLLYYNYNDSNRYQDFQNCASREEEAQGIVGPATRLFFCF